MAHGPQRIKDVRIQDWIDRFQHAAPPFNRRFFLATDRRVPPMKPSPSRSIIEPQLSLRHPLPKKQQVDAGEWSAVETGCWQSPGLQSLHRPRDKGKNPACDHAGLDLR